MIFHLYSGESFSLSCKRDLRPAARLKSSMPSETEKKAEPHPKKSRVGKVIFAIFVIFVLFGVIGWLAEISSGTTSTSTTSYTSSSSIIKVSTSELFNAYVRGNQADADAKYTDKTIIVTGTIMQYGSAVIKSENTGKYFSITDDFVVFYYKSGQDLVRQLKPGQTITVKGICKGLQKSVGGDLIIYIDDCQILEISTSSSAISSTP